MKTIATIGTFLKNLPSQVTAKFTAKTCRSCDETVPFWKVFHTFKTNPGSKGECLCWACTEQGDRPDQYELRGEIPASIPAAQQTPA